MSSGVPVVLEEKWSSVALGGRLCMRGRLTAARCRRKATEKVFRRIVRYGLQDHYTVYLCPAHAEIVKSGVSDGGKL